MKQLQQHRIDRTALIFGLVFSLAGLAYLADDHNIVDVTEGAAAGAVVIIVGLVMLLAALIDSPEAAAESRPSQVAPVRPPTRPHEVPTMTGHSPEVTEPMATAPDFSWAASAEATETLDVFDELNPHDLPGSDEAE